MKEMTDTKIKDYNFQNIKHEASGYRPLGKYSKAIGRSHEQNETDEH